MPDATGPFYFAWVDPDETTFGAEHHVYDEHIFDFTLSQREGDFALLSMTILNPEVGLLSPTRKQWCWFSRHRESTGQIEPLFFGQLLRVPDDARGRLIQITFRAKPEEFDALKTALASSMRSLPYVDPLMQSPDSANDPDAVLQARTELWHVDRVSHSLTASDKIVGEDGTLNYGAADIFYSSLRIRPGDQPPKRCIVDAQINFRQSGTGEIDLSREIVKAFGQQGDSIAPNTITSYTMEGLIRDWPVPGDEIGAGWRFNDANVEEGNGRFVQTQAVLDHTLVGWMSNFESNIGVADEMGGQTTPVLYVPGAVKPTIVVGWTAERSFTEHIHFEIVADLQSVAADDADPIRLSLSSNDASETIDFDESVGGSAPIGDRRRNCYIKTDRGQQTMQYLLLRGRAELLDRARAVSTDFGLRFDEIFNLTCRKNATVTEPRIPGGVASGKIIGYTATGNGDTGEFGVLVTIGSCVGKGDTVTGASGTGGYITNDYIVPTYYVQNGQINLIEPGDLTYEDYSGFPVNDDGVNLFDMSVEQCVIGITIDNYSEVQKAAIQDAGAQLGLFSAPAQTIDRQFINGGFSVVNPFGNEPAGFNGETAGFFQDIADAAQPLVTNFTTITLELIPLTNGPFETDFDIVVSELMVPSQINMEAS